jgi:hypothetical protein
VPVDLELKTLARTRRSLAVQRWLFALAWVFTAFGLTLRITSAGGSIQRVRLLVLELPAVFAPALVAALCCWVAYATLRRRTHPLSRGR